MLASKLAVQLYTLREFTKTPADIASTLKRVKQIGYDAVQVSAIGKIEPAELGKILKGEGLTCVATHGGMERMRDDTSAVIEEHEMWGCKYTAVGGFFPKDATAQTWTDWAKSYNEVSKKFAGSSVKIGYHNHSHELVKYDGQTALDLLMSALDSSVWMEIDTYWITHGGGDPAAWIRKCAGRIPCVHFKDMAIQSDRTQIMAPVGEGNLNWPAIIKACEDVKAEWYIVEQDNCYGEDPFQCLATSLRNLKAMGVN